MIQWWWTEKTKKNPKTQQGCPATATGKTTEAWGEVLEWSGAGWHHGGSFKASWLVIGRSGFRCSHQFPAQISLMSVTVSAGEERTKTRYRIHRKIQDGDKSISVYVLWTVHKKSYSNKIKCGPYSFRERCLLKLLCWHIWTAKKKRKELFSPCRLVRFHSVPLAFDHPDKFRQTEKHPPPQQRLWRQNGE